MLATLSFGYRWNAPWMNHAAERVVDRAIRDDEAAQDVDVAEALEEPAAPHAAAKAL